MADAQFFGFSLGPVKPCTFQHTYTSMSTASHLGLVALFSTPPFYVHVSLVWWQREVQHRLTNSSKCLRSYARATIARARARACGKQGR